MAKKGNFQVSFTWYLLIYLSRYSVPSTDQLKERGTITKRSEGTKIDKIFTNENCLSMDTQIVQI